MRTIVLGIDGSDTSLHAARWAADLATALQARVIALHVRQAPAMVAPEVALSPAFDDYAEQVEQVARERLTPVLNDAGVAWEYRAAAGDPADALAALGDEVGADMIVVGSHGHGAVRRLLLGSVSTRLMHGSHRPVLVVPLTEAGDGDTLTEAGDEDIAADTADEHAGPPQRDPATMPPD